MIQVLSYLQLKTRHTLTDILFDGVTILGIIRSLNPNKSSGWDSISPRMLKYVILLLFVKPIRFTLETCLETGIFPGKWKMYNVCPYPQEEI